MHHCASMCRSISVFAFRDEIHPTDWNLFSGEPPNHGMSGAVSDLLCRSADIPTQKSQRSQKDMLNFHRFPKQCGSFGERRSVITLLANVEVQASDSTTDVLVHIEQLWPCSQGQWFRWRRSTRRQEAALWWCEIQTRQKPTNLTWEWGIPHTKNSWQFFPGIWRNLFDQLTNVDLGHHFWTFTTCDLKTRGHRGILEPAVWLQVPRGVWTFTHVSVAWTRHQSVFDRFWTYPQLSIGWTKPGRPVSRPAPKQKAKARICTSSTCSRGLSWTAGLHSMDLSGEVFSSWSLKVRDLELMKENKEKQALPFW